MGKRILLADDSITIQKVIELTFSDEDFEVVTVGNGRLAVEKVQELRPDVVLCDIIMPEKDGYEVCEFIKKQPNLSHIPVLLLTGAFEPFDQERAARVGCDGFLAKPFEPQTLIAKVKDLLSQAAARPPAPAASPAPSMPMAAAPAAAPAPVAEPSMTYMPDEPVMEEAPLGFADVMDTTPAQVEPLDEPSLDADAFSGLPSESASAEDLLDVSPEEQASLGAPARTPDPGATVMFRTLDPPAWEHPPAAAPLEEDEAPSLAAPSLSDTATFEEVFEEDLSSPGLSDAPPPRFEEPAPLEADDPLEAAAPVEAERLAPAAFEPPPPPFEPAPPVFEPPPPVFAPPPQAPEPEVEDLSPAALPSDLVEPSFAELAPPEMEEAASAAAEVGVPVDQVAQIAQRVVGQISEKVIREIAWEVIPELAEALIRKEIERLKSELQQG